MAKKSDAIDSLSFEEAQQALTDVIAQLEGETADLEKTVGLFERGKALIDHCQVLLDKAELKVSQLEADGSITPVED